MDAEPDADPKALEIALQYFPDSGIPGYQELREQMARAITALLREREERDQKDMDDLDDVARHREGHPGEVAPPELGCFVCRLIECTVREREEEIGRLKAHVEVLQDKDLKCACDYENTDDICEWHRAKIGQRILGLEAALAKKDEALRRIEDGLMENIHETAGSGPPDPSPPEPATDQDVALVNLLMIAREARGE